MVNDSMTDWAIARMGACVLSGCARTCLADYEASGHKPLPKSSCHAQLEKRLIGLEGETINVKWPDGSQETFLVARSGGWMPAHIMLRHRRSRYGAQVPHIPPEAEITIRFPQQPARRSR